MATLAERWFHRGEQKGLKEGLAEGIFKEKLEIARRMLSRNVPVKEIMEYTSLTEGQIRALIQ